MYMLLQFNVAQFRLFIISICKQAQQHKRNVVSTAGRYVIILPAFCSRETLRLHILNASCLCLLL
jgi:hypothetical protein